MLRRRVKEAKPPVSLTRTYLAAFVGPLIGLFILPLALLATGSSPALTGMYTTPLGPTGMLPLFGFYACLFGLVPSISTMGIWWRMNGTAGRTWLRLLMIACVGGLTSMIWGIVLAGLLGKGIDSSLSVALLCIGAVSAVICALMTLSPVGTDEWHRYGLSGRIALLAGPIGVWGILGAVVGYFAWQEMEYARFQRESMAEVERLIGRETAAEVHALPCRAWLKDFQAPRLTLPARQRLEQHRNSLIDPDYGIPVSMGPLRLAVPQRYLQRSAALLNCPPLFGELKFGYWLPELDPTKEPSIWWKRRDEFVRSDGPTARVPVYVTLEELHPSRHGDPADLMIMGWMKAGELSPATANGNWQALPSDENSATRRYFRSETEKIAVECIPSGWCKLQFDMLDLGLTAELETWWSEDDPMRAPKSLRTLLLRWRTPGGL